MWNSNGNGCLTIYNGGFLHEGLLVAFWNIAIPMFCKESRKLVMMERDKWECGMCLEELEEKMQASTIMTLSP